jgi:glycosyltransferase involved in cell wall biosynthesis
VLVVVPAWNEAASIAAVIAEVRAALPEADLLVVDDGSSDRTTQVARAAGADVARLPFNLGVGGAMRTGFRYARRGDYDAVVQIDGDGQHDAAYLTEVLAALDRADVVIGARFAGVGSYELRGPRIWAIRFLSRVISMIMGTRITDATSGFRASGRRAIGVFATHYPAEYLGDTVESLVIARRLGLSVTQVPVAMRPRAGGAASQSVLGASIYLARALAALVLALVRRWPYAEERS